MTHLKFAILAIAALGVSACTNPDRFGAGGGDGSAYGDGDAQAGVYDPASPEYFNQTIGDRVLFAVDQSSLDAEAHSVLSAQAGWINANPEYSALIEGHADEQGTREYNLALGARRANSAQEYLISQGVAPSRLRTVSYGKERPLEICSEESCYRQNRRAVTVISAGAPSS